MKCINCGGWTPTGCTNCTEGLCGECNDELNEDDEKGDGMCWKCREKAAGTYDGEDKNEEEQSGSFTPVDSVPSIVEALRAAGFAVSTDGDSFNPDMTDEQLAEFMQKRGFVRGDS